MACRKDALELQINMRERLVFCYGPLIKLCTQVLLLLLLCRWSVAAILIRLVLALSNRLQDPAHPGIADAMERAPRTEADRLVKHPPVGALRILHRSPALPC